MTMQAPTMKIIAPLILWAVFGAAHAAQIDEPPVAGELVLIPSPREQAREDAEARALAERRERMIAECEDSHGSETDCRREVDTELRAEGLQSGARVIHLAPRF